METSEAIRKIVEPVVDDLGFELVELQLRRESIGLVLRIHIYKEGGVSLDDCTGVSREVGYLLEVDDPIAGAYTLEVSSPGLDRPLTTFRDFERNVGKKISVVFDTAEGKRQKVAGTIGAVVSDQGQEVLHLCVEKDHMDIDLKQIRKAKLVVEF